jgi:hypothetical protein
MRVPVPRADKGVWERAISRYLHGNRIPLTWKGGQFVGLHRYTFRRIVPKRANQDPSQSLSQLPRYFKERADEQNLIVFITNPQYGDSLEDSLVAMRLGTFGPIFETHINNNRERLVADAPDSDG